jgi:threonine aldolase
VAQFEALLTGERWRQYAAHANAMAALLHERIRRIDGIKVTRPVRCNAIFATMDRGAMERVQRQFFFYVFNRTLPEVRWMTHWATTPQEVEEFAECLADVTAPAG